VTNLEKDRGPLESCAENCFAAISLDTDQMVCIGHTWSDASSPENFLSQLGVIELPREDGDKLSHWLTEVFEILKILHDARLSTFTAVSE
jgi:hypothetical protein